MVVPRGGVETPPADDADERPSVEFPPGPCSSEMMATKLQLEDIRKEVSTRKPDKQTEKKEPQIALARTPNVQ